MASRLVALIFCGHELSLAEERNSLVHVDLEAYLPRVLGMLLGLASSLAALSRLRYKSFVLSPPQ